MENDIQNLDQNNESGLITEVSSPLYNSKGWIKLIGILMIIYGAIMALSLVGIIIAWLPIWLGVLLLQVSSRIEQAHAIGSKDMMIRAQTSLATFFTIYGVLALIGIIISVVFIIIGLSTGFFWHMQDFDMNNF